MEEMLIKNRYRLEKKLAQGGMSTVYLCTNIEVGNKWIVKHIDRRYSKLLYEESILKKLNHISLPKIVDIDKDESGIYIVQNYIEGTSLQDKLTGLKGLSLDKLLDYALQLGEVMTYLHNLKSGAIVHKDIKPSNILITEYDRLILIDFGISEEHGGGARGIKAGTHIYAAPEQLAGHSACDTRGDIYSFGIVLNQMLTKGMGTEGHNKPRHLYRRLHEISAQCSRFKPEERIQTAEELQTELLKIRNKLVVWNEGRKLKRKLLIALIFLLSMTNYICFIIAIMLVRS